MDRTRGLVNLIACVLTASACGANEQRPDQPPIIEVFACSDYCPGPEEKYLKKAYEGVVDPESCEAIGGKPFVFIGWGSHFICLAD